MKTSQRLSMLLWSLVVGLGFVAQALWALEPPDAGEIEQLRTTGELQNRLDFARELENYKFSPDLIQRMRQKIERIKAGDTQPELPAPPTGWQGLPTTGNVKVLAVLIAFSDLPFTNAQSTINSQLFGAGTVGFPYESLANYYSRASYTQLNLSGGSTLGWYTTTYPRSSVPETRTGREALIKEVLTSYDASHNFAQYDNDGDGDIDYFIVIWTGPDTGWSGFWWGYQTSFGDSTYTLDGKRLSKYSWQWECRPSPGSAGCFTPRVVIHETGHALGVPDYYDYDDAVGPDGGVGNLDMMDGNWGDHNCFTKWMLDWTTPVVVNSGSQSVTLNASGTTQAQNSVMIFPGAGTSQLFSEYFMVQNRYRGGASNNDSTYPADGMLIWHLDARLNAAGNNFLYDNSYTDHKLLRLMEADGLEEIEALTDNADAEDYYVTGKSFGSATTPNNNAYVSIDSSVSVTTFSAAGATMSATFAVSQSTPRPTGVSATDGTYTDHVQITWNSVPTAGYYRVYRNTVNNPNTATTLGTWQTATSYNDYAVTLDLTYYYWVKAATSNAGANASIFSAPDTGVAGYCTSASGYGEEEYISRVQLNTGDQSSGGSSYTNVPGVFTNLAPGQSYPLSITGTVGDTGGETWPEYVNAWIDFNHDYDFADAGEAFTLGSHGFPAAGSYVYTQTVPIPAGAVLGNTKMRVTLKYGSAPASCGSYGYGETEDYTVLIGSSSSYLLWTK